LRSAAYATALIEQATETETPLPTVYELLDGFLSVLCKINAAQQVVFALELKLLFELGLEPNLAETSLTAGTIKIAEILKDKDWESGLRLKLTSAQVAELRQFLHGFLISHLGRLPKGRTAALADAV